MSQPVHTTETPTEPETTEAAAQQPASVDWEAEAKKWEKRSKENFAKLKEAEPKLAELDAIRIANQSETERQAQELVRWQTEAETWRQAAVGNRIQAIATADFADPSDAVGSPEFADPSKYLDAGGQIDEDAIKADLGALLERKPHWRRQAGPIDTGPRLPVPNLAQGSGGRAAANPADEFAAILQRQLR